MTDLAYEIESRVRSFVADVQALYAAKAVAELERILAGGPAARGPAPRAAAGGARSPTGRRSVGGARSLTGRRSNAAIASVGDAIAEFVRANPGSRMEQVSKGVGLPTRRLARPVRKLLSTGRIRKEGEKRATTYFPGGSPAGQPSGAGKGASKRAR